MAKVKRIGVLTGGGDASGLNAVQVGLIRSLAAKAPYLKIFGILYGWKGLIGKKPQIIILTLGRVKEISDIAGTIIGTSRENPLESEEKFRQVLKNLELFDGLLAEGGDDTMKVALKLARAGVPVITIPKTMDLDLNGTEYSVGFRSYVEAVAENLRGFKMTAKSHGRIIVCEVFGRYSGFTATEIGLVTDADFIAIPEMEIDLDLIIKQVRKGYRKKGYALVIAGESINIETQDRGKIDPHGNELLKERRVGEFLARQIKQMTGIETRSFQASHPFRGISSAYDSVIGLRFGQKAAEMVLTGGWGKMVALVNGEITSLPLESFEPRRVITPGSWWWELVHLRNNGKI